MLLLFSMLGKVLENNGLNNLYTYQAQAFLDGKLNIEEDINNLPGEVALSGGKFYNIFPPFPTILLLPLVAAFGASGVKVSLVAYVIGLLSCYLLYKILKHLEVDSTQSLWIIAAFMLGTAYWQTLRYSDGVWMFAQIVSVCCIFLSINEAHGKGRGALAGLFLGLAFLSRQLSIYSSIFIIVTIWQNPNSPKNKASLLYFLAVFGICIFSYLAFNYAQFGEFGTGYSNMVVKGVRTEEFGGELFQKYGLFSLAHLPFNTIYMFLQGYHVGFNESKQIITLDPYGTSLVAASPFIFISFFAKMERTKLWAAWLSITLALIHMLLYFNNGFIQFNAQRFTLDFMPIMIILIALGLKNASNDLSKLIKGAIVYSIILNVITLALVG
jgi:4-amino-4-deoxy-L-arabinose transferase-like glycosyltransferase